MQQTAVLSVNQAGQYCQVSPQTIVNWINTGKLKAYKTAGGHRRIIKLDLDEFLKRHNMPAFGSYSYPGRSGEEKSLTVKEELLDGIKSAPNQS
jgi:excisionase family DNA binding protein